MNNVRGTKKRIIGATLAALTVVAGMSAVSFAGEPDAQGTAAMKLTPASKAMTHELKVEDWQDGKQFDFGDGNVVTMKKVVGPDLNMQDQKLGEGQTAATIAIEAKEIQTKVDEETGVMYYSLDEGKTWEVMEEVKDGDGNMVTSIAATPAELVKE